ncbi:MAG: DUF4347 domain-containing protein [Aquisalimonadaceae bacterium]
MIRCVLVLLFSWLLAGSAYAQTAPNTISDHAAHGATDLVILDSGAPEPELLIEGLGEHHAVLRIGRGDDPFEAIAEALSRLQSVSSIHLVSHGSAGGVTLGNQWVDAAEVRARSAILAAIGSRLGPDGNVSLYGCDVAANAQGRAFVDLFAEVTGASVAASSSPVGHASLGGNWELDYLAGTVEPVLPFSAASRSAYRHVLSHGRGGSITWQAMDLDGNGQKNDVEIIVKTGWRSDWPPPVGINIASSPTLPGYTSVSTDVIWVNGTGSGDADYGLQTDVFRAYNLDPDTRYQLRFGVCCRISNLENNADAQQGFEGEIYLKDGNLAPKIDLPIIFQVPQLQADGVTRLDDWTFQVKSSDPNADNLRYRLATAEEFGGDGQTNPDGLSINPNTGVITWSNSGNRPAGLYSAGFVAEDLDEDGNRKSKTHVDLILELVNKAQTEFTAPAVTETRNVFVRKGESFTMAINGVAINTQSLGNLQNALVESDTDEYTFTPGTAESGVNLSPGNYPVTFEVRSQTGETSNNYLVVNFVVPDPDAPWIDNLEASRTIYDSDDFQLVAENAAVTYTKNPSLVGGTLKVNVTFIDGEYEVLTVVPEGDGPGQVNLVDGDVFYAGEKIGEVSERLNGLGRPFRVDFTSPSATPEAVEAVVRRLGYRDDFVLRQPGDRALSLFLRDGDGRSNSYDFYVDVQHNPDAPDSGPPQVASNRITLVEGDRIALSGQDINFVDPEGREPVTIDVVDVSLGQFERVDSPGTAVTSFTQNDINLGAIAFAYLDPGDTRAAPSYQLQATAGGDVSAVSAGAVTFSNANLHTPAISGTPETSVDAQSVYQFIPEASDDDLDYGDELVFHIENQPDWATFDPETGELAGTPTMDDVGTYQTIQISVRDQGGLTAALPSFEINVQEPPEATVEGVVVGDGGSIAPSTQSVRIGETAEFTITAASGYAVDSVTGCSGGLGEGVYTTGEIDSACTVEARFIRVASEGAGTTEDPYVLEETEDLPNIADYPDGHFVLRGNGDGEIVLDDTWVPIGTSSEPFTGTLRGEDAPVVVTGTQDSPLFGYVGPGAVIENMNFRDVAIDAPGESNLGLLAGEVRGTEAEPVVLRDIAINGGHVRGLDAVGAIAGVLEHVHVEDVVSTARVEGRNRVGGIAGEVRGAGTVLERTYVTGDVGGETLVGGLAGLAIDQALVRDVYAAGEITASQATAGGVIGLLETATLERAYGMGPVNAPSQAGGLVGASDGATVSAAYWDRDRTGRTDSAGGESRDSAELRAGAALDADTTYLEWFGDGSAWAVAEDHNGGYPYLVNAVLQAVTADVSGQGDVQWLGNYPWGSKAELIPSPATGFNLDSVAGCAGMLSEGRYITDRLDADCELAVAFERNIYALTAAVSGQGEVSPQTIAVAYESTADFTITPDSGHGIANALGCGGTLSGFVFTTAGVTQDCDVLIGISHVADSGLGTEADPYIISDPDDLPNVSTFPTAHFLVQPNEHGQMPVGANWQPIGSESNPFSGSLVGLGGPVEFVGLEGQPLFGHVTEDADVRDVYESTGTPIGMFDEEGRRLDAQTVATGEQIRFRVTGKEGDLTVRGQVLRGVDVEPLTDDAGTLPLSDPATDEWVLQADADGYYTFEARRGGEFTLSFEDEAALTFTVDITVRPQVAFSSTRQPGTAGQVVVVRVVLDGTPGQYPVRVPYRVDGHDLLAASDLDAAGEFLFTEGGENERTRLLELTPNANAHEVVVTLEEGDSVEHALLGNPLRHTIALFHAAEIPLYAALRAAQDAEPVDTAVSLEGGAVTVTVVDPNTDAPFAAEDYAFDWSESTLDLGIHGEHTPAVNVVPSHLTRGQRYDLRLTVTEKAAPGRRVALQSRVYAVDDHDGDVALAYQAFRGGSPEHMMAICPQGVDPFRGVAGRACSQEDRSASAVYLEVPEGYRVSLGRQSERASWETLDFGLEVETDELVGDRGQRLGNAVDVFYRHLGYRVDFEVDGLDFPGQSVPVVIPLPTGQPIPGEAAWRKYHRDGWRNFVENSANGLYSAQRTTSGACPWPGSDRWTDGLTVGDDCVRLVIEDGGPNDFNGEADGVIRDPGSLGTPTPTTLKSGGGGGGSMGLWSLGLLGLLVLLQRCRRSMLAAALLALGSATTASAQDGPQPGWYVGGQLGWAMTDVSSADVTRRMDKEGIDGDASVDDKNRLAGKLFIGHQFNRWLALEAGYTHLGEMETELRTTDTVTARELRDVAPGSGYGAELAVSLGHAFSRHVRGYVRGGVFSWRSERRLSGGSSDTFTGRDPVYGVGLEWRLTQALSTSLSWDRYRVADDDTDLVALGLLYRFGGKPRAVPPPHDPEIDPQPERPAPLPEQRAEPEPQGVVEAVEEEPASLAATEWIIRYGVDETTANSTDDVLDEVALAMQQRPTARLQLTGHTDNTGPAAYNMTVSEQRAGAAADALIERGIEPDRLQVSGQGPDNPMAGNDTAEGRELNRRTEIVLLDE